MKHKEKRGEGREGGGRKSLQKRKDFIWKMTTASSYLLKLFKGRNHAQNSFNIKKEGSDLFMFADNLGLFFLS